jgi:hypothetical protein
LGGGDTPPSASGCGRPEKKAGWTGKRGGGWWMALKRAGDGKDVDMMGVAAGAVVGFRIESMQNDRLAAAAEVGLGLAEEGGGGGGGGGGGKDVGRGDGVDADTSVVAGGESGGGDELILLLQQPLFQLFTCPNRFVDCRSSEAIKAS